MTQENEFNQKVLLELFKKAEPRLAKLLSEHGVETPQDLPQDQAREIFIQAITDTATTNFPATNIEALSHGFMAFSHDDFFPAFHKAKSWVEKETDAFSFATGIDAGIVLAGLGMSVAPFDRKSPKILAETSNKIDVVKKNFLKCKTAYVGYSPCTAPFYILVTDCIKTFQERLNSHPYLEPVRELIHRNDAELLQSVDVSFRHGTLVFPREPGDRFETAVLMDTNPHYGSIGLYAGWENNGHLEGVPNEGFIPVPTAFLRHAMADPEFAMWIWHPVGARCYIQ